MAIDYQRMQKNFPKQKAALTRAKKISDPQKRYEKVLEVCTAAVKDWNECGAWPDDWSLFNRNLWDAASDAQRAEGFGYDQKFIFDLDDIEVPA